MLDRVHWADVPANEVKDIIQSINPVQGRHKLKPESTTMKRAVLPFYKKTRLLEVFDSCLGFGIAPFWYLQTDERCYLLDGSSAPIHDVNELEDICLAPKTAVEFAHFFCFFVHGDEGPFFVVEDIEYPAFDRERMSKKCVETLTKGLRKCEYVLTSEFGTMEVEGTVLYGNAVFDARFAITENGMIEMIDDTPLAADIPARLIKPNYGNVPADENAEEPQNTGDAGTFWLTVSSTFYDFEDEMEVLVDTIIPEVKKYCLKKWNCTFNAVNLNWSKNPEDSIETLENVLKELKKDTVKQGSAFFILAGDRCGTLPSVDTPDWNEIVELGRQIAGDDTKGDSIFAYIRNITNGVEGSVFEDGKLDEAENYKILVRDKLTRKFEVFTEKVFENVLKKDHIEKLEDQLLKFLVERIDAFAAAKLVSGAV